MDDGYEQVEPPETNSSSERRAYQTINRTSRLSHGYDYPIHPIPTTQKSEKLSPGSPRTRVFTAIALFTLVLSLLALIAIVICFVFVFERANQENEMTCEELSPPDNGEISVAPGPNSLSHGMGSVAIYSCHPGYALVGQTNRTCEDTKGGTVTTGTWSGTPPSCQEVVRCQPPTQPSNGAITISSGTHGVTLGRGATATYSCHTGYGLVGQATRICVVTNGGTTGTWSGSRPICQETSCLELSAPKNGSIVLSTTSQLLGVGTTATYSCHQGYVLVGETTRICEDTNSGTTGIWSRDDPICALPNDAFTDCAHTPCRYEQLVCPEEGNCTVDCYDSRSYACFQTGLVCPSRGGDCTLNCDDEYACVQATTTCSQGDCTVNCESDYTCLNSVFSCSGDSCLLNCKSQDSCSNSIVECSSENCELNCIQQGACSSLSVECSGTNCHTNCASRDSCRNLIMDCSNGSCSLNCSSSSSCPAATTLVCPPDGQCNVHCCANNACRRSNFTCSVGGNCLFHFEKLGTFGHNIGHRSIITCEENSTCHIICVGKSNHCAYSHITCPRDSGRCTVECSGTQACQYASITCGRDRDCLSCSGESSCTKATITLPNVDMSTLNCTSTSSCQFARIICPANNTCTINCDGPNSCNSATVTCPSGDYSCNILCTNPLSCSNLSITNTHNVYLQCCGGLSCEGTNVTPASTDCPYIIK